MSRTRFRMMKPSYLGAHTIDNGGIDMAVRRAAAAGMTALQIFTAPPRFYGDRSGIRPERVERFRSALAETEIAPERVVVHGAYVLGVATPDEAKWERAAGGLAKEMERAAALPMATPSRSSRFIRSSGAKGWPFLMPIDAKRPSGSGS